MDEYIKRDYLKLMIVNYVQDDKMRQWGEIVKLTPSEVLEIIDNVPAADVRENVHGKWRGKPICGYSKVRCSVCKTIFLENQGLWKYCPECGADMREERLL